MKVNDPSQETSDAFLEFQGAMQGLLEFCAKGDWSTGDWAANGQTDATQENLRRNYFLQIVANTVTYWRVLYQLTKQAVAISGSYIRRYDRSSWYGILVKK